MATPLTTSQQLQQLQQQFNSRWGGQIAAHDLQAYEAARNQFQTRQMELSNQQMRENASNAAANDPVQKAKDEMYGIARGAVNNVNPIDQLVLQALQERSGKDAGPFDQTTRDALMTSAADAAGQAQLNARGRIHGSSGDQSVIAANNEADARRAQAVQAAQLGINTQANVANYDARGQALGQLHGANQDIEHNLMTNQARLENMLMQETQYHPDGGQPGIPSFTQFSQRTPQFTIPQAPAPQLQQPAAAAPAPRPAQTVAPVAPRPYTPPPVNYGTASGPAGSMINGQFIPNQITKTVSPTQLRA